MFVQNITRLFNPSNVTKAHAFFERHGSKTIIMARFVPIVRTFAPIVAGVAAMRYRVFSTFNLIGGVVWGVGVPLLGFWLGKRFPSLQDRIDVLAVVIVAVSLLPVAFEFLKHRRERATHVD